MNKTTELEIRFDVRQVYRQEGTLNEHRKYPLGSWERGVALDEGHKILFAEQESSEHGEPI